ncbi:hypothetical protein KI387_036480, partial [Taxus chinensis]
MGIQDVIPIRDHKKGFHIDLDTCAYFSEEAEPQKKSKSKLHSENLFEALTDKQVQKLKHNKSDHAKDENLMETSLDEDLNFPPDPTHMEDLSKLLVEETIDVNI